MHIPKNCDARTPVHNWDDSRVAILIQYLLMGGLTAVAMFALVAL
jgi:hypothetical protein